MAAFLYVKWGDRSSYGSQMNQYVQSAQNSACVERAGPVRWICPSLGLLVLSTTPWTGRLPCDGPASHLTSLPVDSSAQLHGMGLFPQFPGSEDRGSDELSHFPKVTQLAHGRGGADPTFAISKKCALVMGLFCPCR